jgi:hypothetical protein
MMENQNEIEMDNNWKEKYWDFIIADNIEDALPIKYSNFPNSFFKYKSLSELTIQSIKENYIWVAEISTLNDPFECSMQFDNDECLRAFYGSEQFENSFSLVTGKKLSKQELEKLTTSEKPHKEYISICKEKNIPYFLT